MCAQVRAEELMARQPARRGANPSAPRDAGLSLLEAYAALAERGEHLLGQLLQGQAPRQWAHYPEDDAIDRGSSYQWFYHSHSPEDRPGAVEHGHIHLFARRPLWASRLRSRAERDFADLCGGPRANPGTRHLLAISLDAKGIPMSLFTVNSWVTGDLMLSASLTLELLSTMRLRTGHVEIDTVIESVIRLCSPEMGLLLTARDAALRSHSGAFKLEAPELELLSEIPIDLDGKLQGLA